MYNTLGGEALVQEKYVRELWNKDKIKRQCFSLLLDLALKKLSAE
jgi:hypothetical protein